MARPFVSYKARRANCPIWQNAETCDERHEGGGQNGGRLPIIRLRNKPDHILSHQGDTH
jgi:hypothetical protein